MKIKLTILSLLLLSAVASAQTPTAVAVMDRKDIHILAVNDMHAKLENMPRLAAIVDSLRAIDPELLVLAAGDNRTGNPYNDQYEPTSYPMVSLMNFIGFSASAFGNHEFDSREAGLAKVTALSNFPYLAANVYPPLDSRKTWLSFKIFNIGTVSVGVLGVVQLGANGIPDTHPDNVKRFMFAPVNDAIRNYKWLRKKCDVNILLSHIGYEDDVKVAESNPDFDLIVGGHSHTQLNGGEIHNGVLITQNVNRLKRATLITLTVDNHKVINKKAENIDVENYPHENKIATQMVKMFTSDESFNRQLGTARTAFGNTDELGIFMCDAIRHQTNADIALWNFGGVRLEELPAGPITVATVLTLDPFGNNCIEMNLTGKEFHDLFLSCYKHDEMRVPYTSGNIHSTVTFDKNNPTTIKSLVLTDSNGHKLNMRKTYRVVMNNYVSSICDSPRKDQGRNMNIPTAELIMKYLKQMGEVSYAGQSNQTIIR